MRSLRQIFPYAVLKIPPYAGIPAYFFPCQAVLPRIVITIDVLQGTKGKNEFFLDKPLDMWYNDIIHVKVN